MEAAGRDIMVTSAVEDIDDKKVIDITDVPIEELRWCTVALSEVLTRGSRLDASVFDIEGKHARDVLSQCKWDLVQLCGKLGLSTSYYPSRFKRIWVEESEYPIYQPSQIVEAYPQPNAWLSEITKANFDELRAKKGQILLTRSGTIGKCTVVSNTLSDKIISDDMIHIDCNQPFDVGYIYAFLRTRIGGVLVNTNTYGAVISHIEPEHLEEVLIPNPAKEIKVKINDSIMKSFSLRDESNKLIDKAHDLLKEELRLPELKDLKPKYFNADADLRSYSVKLSELSNRLDGSYHVPVIDSIMDHIKRHSSEVKDIADPGISKDIILPGRFKRVYVEEGQGTVFFGGKQLYELDPSNKKYLSLQHHAKRIKEQLTLEENMIMITCSGTIGKVMLAPKHWEGWTANQHIIRVVPADDSVAGYIYAWLSTPYGYELVHRFTYGAVVDEIDDNHVSQVQIPLLNNKEKQKEINDLVLEANRKRYEAYVLEQQAIRVVEDEVIQEIK